MILKQIYIKEQGKLVNTDYFISNNGKVFREIKACNNGNGYSVVVIYHNKKGITKSVHKLVASAFLQPIKGKELVNHKNGDKTDNRVANLEWCTAHENTLHFHRSLRVKPLYNAKGCLQISDGIVIAEYSSLKDAERKTGISSKNICCCCNGKTTTAGGYEWRYK